MVGRGPGVSRQGSIRGCRVAIVASRFHEEVSTRLVEGARDALRRHGVTDADLTVVWVPGAFEISQAVLQLARGGKIDAFVCVGCVVRGATPHFEYVAAEAARGIGEVGRRTGIPTTFGVVTANTIEQAFERAGGPVGNRGEEAAVAAVELLTLFPPGRRPPARRRRQGAKRG